jgi:mRNA interferase YafO
MPPAPTPPKVQLTALLRQALIDEGLDPNDFAEYFAGWKAMGPAGEYEDYYFGKDGFYDAPKRGGRRVLKHVHMPPDDVRADPADPKPVALVQWDKDWGNRRRKTSDTSLIYAEDPGHGYLLIYLAREPTGHELARMATPASKTFMNQLADVAEQFIFSGAVVI